MENMTSKIPPNMTVLRGETESGEGVAVIQPRRRRRVKGFRDRTGLIDFNFMTKLELTQYQMKILYAVMSFVPPKGGRLAYCTQADIARKTGIHRVDVAKNLQVLRDRNIIVNKTSGQWLVSAWLMYNGDYDSWAMECDEDQEPIWTKNVNPTTGEVS